MRNPLFDAIRGMDEAEMADLVDKVNSNNERAVFCDDPTDRLDEGLGPKGWPAIRAVVLHRDGYRCYLCGDQATEVDHLWPRARGGSDRLSNLRASCRVCNATKGDALRLVHITTDRSEDAAQHYLRQAVNALWAAARWQTVANRVDDRYPDRLSPSEMSALMPAEGDVDDRRSVVAIVASVLGVES